jgi:hypothetical protein
MAAPPAGRRRYIDKSGKIAISPQFDKAGDFSDGLVLVEMGNQYGYIGKDGKLKIRPQFDQAGEFAGGLPPVWLGNRQGYINESGKYVWNPTS